MDVFPWVEDSFAFFEPSIRFKELPYWAAVLGLASIEALAPFFLFSASIRSSEIRIWFSFSLSFSFKGLSL